MIHINLLPRKVRKEVFKSDLILFALLLTIAFVLSAGIYVTNAAKIASLKNDVVRTKASIASMEKFYKEYLALEKQKKELSARISLIEKIKEGRALAARILFDLPTLVKESVWLKRFKKDEDRFDLEGRALENESIADFVERLSKIPYAKEVELKSVEDVTEEGMVIKKFLVQGSLGL
jgi:type IV pilus assembly protein PilN